MNTLHSSIVALLAAGLLASSPLSAQEEDKDAADLQSYSVGERRSAIQQETLKVERPKFENTFKLEAPKPVLNSIQIQRPTLQVVTTPETAPETATAAANEPPVRTAESAGAAPTVQPESPGGPTQPVRPLRMDPPEYPRDAFRRRQEGYVVVEFTINAQGTTEDIAVVDAEPRNAFEREARRAVSRWTFQPALRDGRPVAQRIRHTLEFSLNGK